MKARSLIYASALLLCSPFSLSAVAEPEKFFPVMPWNHVPNDKAVVQKIKECGFTVAGFVSPSQLAMIEAAGLKGIVQDPRIYNCDWTNVDANTARSNVVAAVTPLAKHPVVYGFYLRDEPPSSFFPGLKIVSSVVRELAPDKWAYINLFPNYAENWQLGASSYEEYLEKFVEACQPTQLSYDHYAMMDDGSLREGYWRNLEQIRSAAKKHKLPFWNIILSVAHFNYREPSAADLRFQVYSSLASGARGLAYFTYLAPQVGNYRGAPIDQFGNPTPTWGWMQNVNLQIQKLAPTLLDLTSDDVYHSGSVPNGCHAAPTNSLVANIGPDFAVGDFTHTNGSRYVMLVNKNVSKSAVWSPEFRTAPKALKLISPYTGNPMAFEGEQVWIAPGAGALLKLE